jgi:hypothetical protein
VISDDGNIDVSHNDATSHDAVVEQHGAMPLGVVPVYNGAVACGVVLWVYFGILSPKSPYVEFLLKKDQNAKLMKRLRPVSLAGSSIINRLSYKLFYDMTQN